MSQVQSPPAPLTQGAVPSGDGKALASPADGQPRRKYIDVSDGGEISVRVFPLAYRVLESHADTIMGVVNSLGSIPAEQLRAAGMNGVALWRAIAPVAGRQLLQVISESCRPSLSEANAPAVMVAEVAAAWFELSFFGGGLERMQVAAGALLSNLSGGASSSARPSPDSSASASRSTTSTTAPGTTGTPNAA